MKVFASAWLAALLLSGSGYAHREPGITLVRTQYHFSPQAHLALATRGNTGRHTCDASDLCDLVGFVVVACSNVVGTFEGADFGKSVSLVNGMIFTFEEYEYSYSYQPNAVVLAHSITYQGTQVTLYKLVIDDEIYDVRRVR